MADIRSWAEEEERKRVLATWLERFGGPADPEPRWYAVDAAVEAGGLQLVQRDGRDPMARTPAMLDAGWYPAATVPAVLPAVLATATGAVVRRTLDRGPDRAEALREVAAVFAGLVPTAERPGAVARTAGWLERVADRLGRGPAAVPAPPPTPAADHALATALAPFGPRLSAYAAAVGGPAELDPVEARDRVVARIAHAVALLAQLAPDDLRVEAALLRGLLVQTGDDQGQD